MIKYILQKYCWNHMMLGFKISLSNMTDMWPWGNDENLWPAKFTLGVLWSVIHITIGNFFFFEMPEILVLEGERIWDELGLHDEFKTMWNYRMRTCHKDLGWSRVVRTLGLQIQIPGFNASITTTVITTVTMTITATTHYYWGGKRWLN